MPRTNASRRQWLQCLARGVAVVLGSAVLGPAGTVHAGTAWAANAATGPAAEIETLRLRREDGGLQIDATVKVQLPAAVEEALRRGVPLYFAAEARVLKPRWYWRDGRMARTSRTWRVSYQPLTGNYRVSLGGLNQSVASLAEAMVSATRVSGWNVAEPGTLDSDERYVLEFSWRLDTAQLPRPMQFGVGGAAEWQIGVERTVRLDP